MSLASQSSTLNPNAPLFIPAVVRQVEDFSPEWWQLVKTSTWFHDYWLSQQHRNNGFSRNTTDDYDIVDMLPDSIDTDEALLPMEAQCEQFINSSSMEAVNSFGLPCYQPLNDAETLSLPKYSSGSRVEIAMHPENKVESFSPKIHSQRTQQPH